MWARVITERADAALAACAEEAVDPVELLALQLRAEELLDGVVETRRDVLGAAERIRRAGAALRAPPYISPRCPQLPCEVLVHVSHMQVLVCQAHVPLRELDDVVRLQTLE